MQMAKRLRHSHEIPRAKSHSAIPEGVCELKIDEALEVLREIEIDRGEKADAITLGIEALKRVVFERKCSQTTNRDLLPGEPQ